MNAENQNIEYKETWRDDYLKWICGFANAQGGKPKGVYHYRSGSTKQELNGIALQQFVLKKLGRTWDDIICEQATINDIDRKAVDYFLRKAVDAQRLPNESLNSSTEDVLRNLHLVDADGKLKNAAILLFGKCPQDFITGVNFKIGFFGRDDADLIFQDLIEGNILKMCDTVVETLKAKYLISPIHYEGLQRIEPLEIPEDALREAIFNSIIHKDYMGVAIQMKVWRDRIELWNYGRLPEELTIAKLHEPHASNARNKNIAFAFYKAGFIEAWGRGISKIITQFTEAGLKEPKFEDFCGGVRVTIYRNTDLVSETIEKNNGGVTNNEENVQKNVQENVQENDQENDQKSTQKTDNVDVNNNTEDGVDRIFEGKDSTQKSTQKIDGKVTVNNGEVTNKVTVNDDRVTEKVTNKVTNGVTNEVVEKVTENQRIILNEIEKNAIVTVQQLADILHISVRKTKLNIAKLKDKGLIRHVGTTRNGHWEIVKQNNNN